MAANRDPVAGKRLDSWKEIASFFGRAERTVKRWETERGLPVHRLPGSGRSSVFAYSDELADWLKGRRQELEAENSQVNDSQVIDSCTTESGSPEGVAPAADLMAVKPLPARTSPPSFARIAAWLGPLLFAAALVAYFSLGHQSQRYKALASRHSTDPEAQDLYLKGRYFWDRRTPEDLNKAIDYFTQAIVKDPSDAAAYVGLADCYNLLREFGAMPPSEAYPRALSAAQRAVELDDTSSEAHTSLAFTTFWWSWQGATAGREFKRALELDPASVRAHHWYATYLLGTNRLPESIDQLEQARRLEPSSNAILADKGYVLYEAGRSKEGVALLTQLETTDPSLSSTHNYLATIYWERKEYAKALVERRRAAELRHDQAGLSLADAGEKGFAINGLKGLYENELPIEKDQFDRGEGNAYALATAYAALGKRDEALACLQTSFERHEAAMLMGDPIPELQNDPDYQEFRTRVQEMLKR
jgi:tetratricopeptide (TPR) repeat protein